MADIYSYLKFRGYHIRFFTSGFSPFDHKNIKNYVIQKVTNKLVKSSDVDDTRQITTTVALSPMRVDDRDRRIMSHNVLYQHQKNERRPAKLC